MLEIALPRWTDDAFDRTHRFGTDDERMELVLRLARENVEQETGGPFAAAVFEGDSGLVVGVGVNTVVPHRNSMLHAEVVAIMLAEQAVGSHTLGEAGAPRRDLVASCEPCAMCLGAVLWSGVRRLVCGAARDDAASIGFDEGPVFPASYAYLESRGIEVVRGIARGEATRVLELYRDRGGEIYNA